MTPNEQAATHFAGILTKAGFPAKARPTAAVAGVKVKDGWAVNIRDEDTELGCVAVFYGRNHCKAYIEFLGYSEAADELGTAFAVFMTAARNGWDWRDPVAIAIDRKLAEGEAAGEPCQACGEPATIFITEGYGTPRQAWCYEHAPKAETF